MKKRMKTLSTLAAFAAFGWALADVNDRVDGTAGPGSLVAAATALALAFLPALLARRRVPRAAAVISVLAAVVAFTPLLMPVRLFMMRLRISIRHEPFLPPAIGTILNNGLGRELLKDRATCEFLERKDCALAFACMRYSGVPIERIGKEKKRLLWCALLAEGEPPWWADRAAAWLLDDVRVSEPSGSWRLGMVDRAFAAGFAASEARGLAAKKEPPLDELALALYAVRLHDGLAGREAANALVSAWLKELGGLSDSLGPVLQARDALDDAARSKGKQQAVAISVDASGVPSGFRKQAESIPAGLLRLSGWKVLPADGASSADFEFVLSVGVHDFGPRQVETIRRQYRESFRIDNDWDVTFPSMPVGPSVHLQKDVLIERNWRDVRLIAPALFVKVKSGDWEQTFVAPPFGTRKADRKPLETLDLSSEAAQRRSGIPVNAKFVLGSWKLGLWRK
ncbi:MAG: hypothetical protein D6806_14345 [Deltaproteobacteria bacterium]|nr:MAG: hypothetical protein D6806_14345 [Deltaproteobacteria bacterium]